MTERLRLRHYPFFQEDRLPDLVVDVEYREIPHYLTHPDLTHGVMRAYEIVVDGVVRGTIRHSIESTDRHIRGTRLRHPGRGRKAWSWETADRKSQNSPGVYASSRRVAAAKILGYSDAARVS